MQKRIQNWPATFALMMTFTLLCAACSPLPAANSDPAALEICAPGPRDNCVVDGDTIWWVGEKIRLADIDTPEMRGKCSSESERAIQARDRLAVILGPGFQIHRSGTDRYGRTLAVLTVDGRSAGDQLVREGLARTWSGRREPWC